MQISVPEESTALSVPPEFITLVGVTSHYYQYLVRYVVNASEALRERASVVKISVALRPANANPPSIVTTVDRPTGVAGLNPALVTRSLLTRASAVRNAVTVNQQTRLLTVTSDLTAWIPNDQARSLSRGTNTVVKRVRKFVTTTTNELAASGVSYPILETPIVFGTSVDSQTVKTFCLNLIHNFGIDPASLIKRQNAVVHSETIFGGLSQIPGDTAGQVNHPEAASVVQSLNGLQINPQTGNTRGVVAVPVTEDQHVITVTERFDIPVGLVGTSNFYFVFELMRGNKVLQSRTELADHEKLLAASVVPTLPPELSAGKAATRGTCVLFVSQTDPKASGVAIYRRVVPTSRVYTDAQYQLVTRLPLTVLDGSVKVVDSVNNTNPVIYRAVSYGRNSGLSAEFGSTVARAGQTKPRRSFVSLSGRVSTLGVQLEIGNIPSSVVAVQVVRSDVSSRTRDLAIQQPIKTTGTTLFAIDSSVKPNRTYSYACLLIYRDGSTVRGSSELAVDYTPETRNVVDTRIINARGIQTEVGLDIRFTIQTTFRDTGEGQVRQALVQQQQNSLYPSEVTRASLQDLVAYAITRTNKTTGEVEDMGVVVSREFSDRETGSPRGVKPPAQGNEYMYTAVTHLRSATTALEGVSVTVTDPVFPARNYTYQPWKWQHPVTLTDGNIISTESLSVRHPETQFTFGEVGKIATTTVSLSSGPASVLFAKAVKVNPKTIKLHWKVQGEVTKVDHFVVVMEVLGMRTVVGKCHNITNTDYFEFYDTLIKERGSINYAIVPVLYDYTRGTEAKTNSVLV